MGLRKKIKKFFYTRKFSKKNYLANINNKNVLITGANSGIWLALTKKTLALDNKVLATYRERSENLECIENKNLTIVKYDQEIYMNSRTLKKR